MSVCQHSFSLFITTYVLYSFLKELIRFHAVHYIVHLISCTHSANLILIVDVFVSFGLINRVLISELRCASG